MTEALQLPLFESSASSSSSDASSSLRSSAPATSSSGASKSTTIDATSGRSTIPASARRSDAGVGSAARSSSAAIATVEVAAQLPLSKLISRSRTASELRIPRPLTIEQCARGQEARPCPWVGCRHHLLLEVALAKVRWKGDRRPTSLRLNGPLRTRRKNGRRPGLASSSAAAVVRAWIDEAVEQLSRIRYTCTWDFVADHPDGVEAHELADVLGVSEQLIDAETREAVAHYVEACEAHGLNPRELLG